MASADVIHVDVAEMIDLAIGTPEAGVVDFNMLQSVLHVLAQQQHVLRKGVELRGYPPPPKVSPQTHSVTVTEYTLETKDGQEKAAADEAEIKKDTKATGSQQTMLVVERIKKGGQDEKSAKPHEVRFDKQQNTDTGPERRLSVVTLHEFHKLEGTVDKIKSQVYGGGQRNEQLLEHARNNPGSTAISDMWTSLNVSTRIEALEEGVGKLSSLVQDLAANCAGVQSSGGAGVQSSGGAGVQSSGGAGVQSSGGAGVQSSGGAGVQSSGGAGVQSSGGAGVQSSGGAGVQSSGGAGVQSSGGPGRPGGGGGADDSTGTGAGSGQASRETELLRAELDRLARAVYGTDDVDGQESGKPVTTRELKVRMDAMEKRIRECCEKIDKVDGVVGDQLTSFQDQLIGLGEDISSVNENLNLTSGNMSPDLKIDVQGVTDLFRLVRELQHEVKSVRTVAETLAQEKDERGFNLNMLIEQVELLKTIKMDREDMAEAMAEKADARMLARKVSHDQFENACDDLSRGLDNALCKLNTQESLWQQALDDIQREIETKLDKLELAPVKQFFIDKLRSLQENLRQMADLRREAEAAGTKKKFLRDVNCISCDARAIMAMAEETMVPAPRAMPPAHLSIKPYLTYELDTIRKQQAAGLAQRNMHDWENIDNQSKQKPMARARSTTGKHICTRYCGGSHTVTTAAQRVARAGHFLREWGPDVMQLGPNKEPKNVKDESTKTAGTKTLTIKEPADEIRNGVDSLADCGCLEAKEDGARG